MRCKRCKSKNPPEAKHCRNCGAPLEDECISKEPFYSKTWFIVIMSILLPFVVIILLWVSKKPKNKTKRIVITVLLAIYCLFTFVGAFGSDSDTDTSNQEVTESKESSDKEGKTGIEVKKSDSEKYGKISEFSYDISNGTIKLEKYNGKCKILEILPEYEVDGETYQTDLSEFQIGIGNSKVESVILQDGIKTINNSAFNSTDVKKVFFPSTMENVDDKTLSYLHPSSDDEKVQIYYAGTEDDWYNIFAEYQRKTLDETESGEEVGESLADKLNELAGAGYDSEEFEFFFSASPDDLKTE